MAPSPIRPSSSSAPRARRRTPPAAWRPGPPPTSRSRSTAKRSWTSSPASRRVPRRERGHQDRRARLCDLGLGAGGLRAGRPAALGPLPRQRADPGPGGQPARGGERAPAGDRRVGRQGAGLPARRLRASGRPPDEPLRRHLPAARHPRPRRGAGDDRRDRHQPPGRRPFRPAAQARRGGRPGDRPEPGDLRRARAAVHRRLLPGRRRDGRRHPGRRRPAPGTERRLAGPGRGAATGPERHRRRPRGAEAPRSQADPAVRGPRSPRSPLRPCRHRPVRRPALRHQGPEAAHVREPGQAGAWRIDRTMGISGSLKDVSVADVMQFVHLGRRTGTLLLSRGAERAMIGFHVGKLVSAQAPRTPKLGDLLVSSGAIDREVLDSAIAAQGEERERRSLGQILIGGGAIGAEELRDVIGRQIEQAVAEVMVWDTGTFEFAIDDLRPIDDIALYPSDVLPDADINTQMVLLEAARIFDERSRNPQATGGIAAATAATVADPDLETTASWRVSGDSTHPSLLSGDDTAVTFAEAAEPAVEPRLAAEQLELQVVSVDEPFANRLERALQHELAAIHRVSLAEAGSTRPGLPPPIVLLDLRRAEVSLEQASQLHRRRPAASLIALVDPGTPFARVYEAGVLAALPAEVEAVVACVENVIGSRRDVVRGGEMAEGRTDDGRSGVARLRRVFGDLRSGLISATVALNLMHIISESVERAVLFLVKRDQLVALGAFGSDARGRPLAELTRAVKLPLEGDNALIRSLETGEVQTLNFEEADLPESFRALVGRPRTGQVVIFPVLGTQRVISVIYADNDDREEPVEDIDILELATAQVGMAFENELLRRQISQNKE